MTNKTEATLEKSKEMIDSEHVNKGDMPARQPDSRDQQGQPFDGGLNEETAGTESPHSEALNEQNRYESVDHAQSRTLPTQK
ncbi:hypothetical protein [Psychrobacter sp. I-STPA6b]|uniref:hypothetical protein n=1 Tax=Psychrobacter sp. I-STPA6b TaxID=2585718 RepID=UPI001D0CCE69|nr:hypothetical protein [Psychrobacter sp. I-STPA6b]